MHFFYCIFFHLIIPSINLTRTSALILVAFTPVRFIIKAKKKMYKRKNYLTFRKRVFKKRNQANCPVRIPPANFQGVEAEMLI